MNLKRGWFSGRIVPCHGTDPGSIPGSRIHFGYRVGGLLLVDLDASHYFHETGCSHWEAIGSDENEVPRERMRSPQPIRNYSVEIPTWSTHTQRRRLSARPATRIAGWPS